MNKQQPQGIKDQEPSLHKIFSKIWPCLKSQGCPQNILAKLSNFGCKNSSPGPKNQNFEEMKTVTQTIILDNIFVENFNNILEIERKHENIMRIILHTESISQEKLVVI